VFVKVDGPVLDRDHTVRIVVLAVLLQEDVPAGEVSAVEKRFPPAGTGRRRPGYCRLGVYASFLEQTNESNARYDR
jgi:hypothetical protein